MKILVVNENEIVSRKLKLLFSKYGECEIASGKVLAINTYKRGLEANTPLSLICFDIGVKAIEVVNSIRTLEMKNDVQKKTEIVLLTEADQIQDMSTFQQDSHTNYLLKPYDRKKLENLLSDIGIHKIEEKQEVIEPEPSIDKAKLDGILKKIHGLVKNTEKFKGVDIRKVLEGLVKEGGVEAEKLVAQYLASDKTPHDAMLELIHSAGYIRSSHFLIPLNRIINSSENTKMINDALVSISMYNNMQALNILNQAIKKFKNPMLLNTLRTEIGKIKTNKPLLGILPRFLQSYKDLKNFRINVDIIKNILNLEDVDIFINYMKSGNPKIEDASFEILCFTGPIQIKKNIFNYFEDRIQKIPCMKEADCFDLYQLLSHLKAYLLKNIDVIGEQLDNLVELYDQVKDNRAKQEIISILAKCRESKALDFIKEKYLEDTKLKEFILEELSGNQKAVDFLFERYHSGIELKEKVIQSLLNTQQGVEYFIKNFFSFEIEKQETIVKNFPFSNQEIILNFIREIYNSKLYNLKYFLLNKLKENHLFSFKDVLFDKDNMREFLFMGKEYIETVSYLFPIETTRMFLEKIWADDNSNNKVKKYLGYISPIVANEIVLDLKNNKFVENLFSRILAANNPELNILFFSILYNIKVLDIRSYKNLLSATNNFLQTRGAHIKEQEKNTITKFKNNLISYFADIRRIEELPKELKIIFLNKPIEVKSLEKILTTSHYAVASRIDQIALYFNKKLSSSEYMDPDDFENFKLKFQHIHHIMTAYKDIFTREDFDEIPDSINIMKKAMGHVRFVLSFEKKKHLIMIKEQLQESIPYIQIEIDKAKIDGNDLLICDTTRLKHLLDSKQLNTQRVFLFLENRGQYAPFREMNPKAILQPISGFRLTKLVLNELFLDRVDMAK